MTEQKADSLGWRLTKAEINALCQKTGWTGGDIPNCSFMEFCNRLDMLAARRLQEYLDGQCTEHWEEYDGKVPHSDCAACMQELREELGLDG
jgi:hypothetical protein